jgi:hypothetical protein
MTISKKQLEANRKNAQKGGVKTPEGKDIVKYNALKHGLLAKEIVIPIGDGTEDPNVFGALLADLRGQLSPEGTLEEMLVEKIAVAYWRMRRAYEYEAGLIRDKLDDATDRYYGSKKWDGEKQHKTDTEIEKEIVEFSEYIQAWEDDKSELAKIHKSGKSLETTYDWGDNWEFLLEKVMEIPELDVKPDSTPSQLHEFLKKQADWDDKRICQEHIVICDEFITSYRDQIQKLEKEKTENRLRLDVIKKLGSIPSREELDRLLRYEGAIERQFYKALNQLERLQRLRLGDNVPAPIEMNIDVNEGQTD